MALIFLTKLNFWRRKLYRIWLDSSLPLSWFTTVCSSSLFLTDLERHQLIDPAECHVFEVFVFEPIGSDFWKTAKFTLSRYSTTAKNGVVYKWYLILFFSTSQWFGTIKQFCAIIIIIIIIIIIMFSSFRRIKYIQYPKLQWSQLSL